MNFPFTAFNTNYRSRLNVFTRHYSCLLTVLLITGVEGLKTKHYSDTGSLLFGELII